MNTQNDDLFETVTRNGKTYRVVKDRKQVSFKMTMMDSNARLEQVGGPSKTRHAHDARPVRISDGSGDPLSLCRPGFRMVTAADKRAAISEERELDRLSYLDSKDAEFRNTSPGWSNNPPTGQGEHGVPTEQEAGEGFACTVRNQWFPLNVGDPGMMRWYAPAGAIVCVPLSVKKDAADAAGEDCYQEYDRLIGAAWQTPAAGPVVANDAGVWNNEAWIGPNLLAEEEDDEETDDEEEDEGGDDDDDLGKAFEERAIEEAVNQTQTHTDLQQRRSVPDRLQRDHEARMRQLKPQLREWATFNDRLAAQQKSREKIMDAEYGKYDAALQEAWRK